MSLLRTHPRAAKVGYKSFPGDMAQERTTLLKALRTILEKRSHRMGILLKRAEQIEISQLVSQPDLTIEAIRLLIPRVVLQEFVQVTDTNPPYSRYKTPFLDEFFDPTDISHSRPSLSQENIATPQPDTPITPGTPLHPTDTPTEDDDDTVIPNPAPRTAANASASTRA